MPKTSEDTQRPQKLTRSKQAHIPAQPLTHTHAHTQMSIYAPTLTKTYKPHTLTAAKHTQMYTHTKLYTYIHTFPLILCNAKEKWITWKLYITYEWINLIRNLSVLALIRSHKMSKEIDVSLIMIINDNYYYYYLVILAESVHASGKEATLDHIYRLLQVFPAALVIRSQYAN